MNTITDTFAGMLNDIENETNFGDFVKQDGWDFYFHNYITGADYVFTYDEIFRKWAEIYG